LIARRESDAEDSRSGPEQCRGRSDGVFCAISNFGADAEHQKTRTLPIQLSKPTVLISEKPTKYSFVTARWLSVRCDCRPGGSRLGAHGFTVYNVYTANGVIDFAGSAAAIREAFHTEIHNCPSMARPISPMSSTRGFRRPWRRRSVASCHSMISGHIRRFGPA